MTSDTEKLGGRLALLDPVALSVAQKEIYDRVDDSLGALANRIHVQSKTGG
jgi:4-carboxymuconolactone decarboxylase